MLSIEHVKKLIDDPTLTDDEVRQIRDGFQQLADIIFEKWQEDMKKKKNGRQD